MRHYSITSILLLAAMLICVGSAGATDWHVNAGESIQDAIDNATDGDTVIVHDGIYTEQLYIAKSLDLRAADGESPEIWAPAPETLESYDFDFDLMPELIKSYSATPIIMVNGSSSNVSVNITGFVIDGSSVIPGTSEFGIDGILYLRADGKIEDNEVKNIWGKVERTAEGRFMWNGKGVFMFSDSSNDVTICRNNVHDYTGEETFGIYVMGKGCRSAITENTITGARSSDFPDQTGIGVCNFATAKVTDNIISDCIYTEEWPWAAGITFTDANGTIEGNTVTGGGIWLNSGFFSAHSTISIRDNTVDASGVDETDCGPLVGVGVYLYEKLIPWYEGEPSVTATIEDNLLIGVSDICVPNVGISLTGDKNTSNGSMDVMITRNTISGWEHGIELFKQSNSMIYLNDFVDNQENAVIENSTNLCNSPGKMRYLYDGEEYTNYLGNYWSDYTGSDSDGDGIGDDPYTITGDNPDRYPLVEIYENYRLSITPEELFESLAGEWAFEGSMILGNDTIPINGTRTFILTGPSSADFVVAYKMGEAETTETGSAWWDGERKQLAIKEGDEMGYSNLTINGYESRAVLEDGIPELNISEAVVSRESLTILDNLTQVMEWTAVNMNGETLCSGKLTFKPVALDSEIGVLIIAHGSSSGSWCAPVRATVDNVSLPYPVELGFLEKVPGESIEDAVDKLDRWNVSKIIAVPLFVSSSSNHISEIEYILGLRDEIEDGADLVRVNTTANITLTSAMDDHWVIGSILTDNTADLSEDPENETVVVVAHGTSNNEEIFAGWNKSSATLAEQTLLRLRYFHDFDIEGARYSFINLNETLHPDLAMRAVVEEISNESMPVVLSRILSPGYHTTKKIPELLGNLTYIYDSEKTLATHPDLAKWIYISVYESVSDLSFSVYDNGEIKDLRIEGAAAMHDGGKLCVSVAAAWRASQFVLSDIWGCVDQSNLAIISAHPSDGHEATFLYVLNNSTEDYVVNIPEGTDLTNLSIENYVYTFTRKSTGDSVTIRVKDKIIPDEFFELRKKYRAKTLTPEEMKMFKLIKNELKSRFMYLPVDEFFDVEV